jgi:hypothetical protein
MDGAPSRRPDDAGDLDIQGTFAAGIAGEALNVKIPIVRQSWAWTLAVVLPFLPMPSRSAVTADVTIEAMVPDAPGSLTLCRNWLLFRTCKTYGHIVLPKVVTTGGHVMVTYGSDTKSYQFPVTKIVRTGEQCIIYGEPGELSDQIDHIVIPSCREAPRP